MYDILVIVHASEMWIIPASEIKSSNLSLRTTRTNGKDYRWDKYRLMF
jgi:hypothetical protein